MFFEILPGIDVPLNSSTAFRDTRVKLYQKAQKAEVYPFQVLSVVCGGTFLPVYLSLYPFITAL